MKRNMFVLLISMMVAAGCATTDPMDMPPASGGNWMPDAEVLSIVQTANEGEVMQGQAASSRAQSDEVRAFAQMLVSDHTAALDRLRTVASANGMTAAENESGRMLRDSARRTVDAVNTYRGRDFDREFIRVQVANHEWLLTSLDNTLIPSTRNAALRTLLQTQRNSVATHLDRARRIQSGL